MSHIFERELAAVVVLLMLATQGSHAHALSLRQHSLKGKYVKPGEEMVVVKPRAPDSSNLSCLTYFDDDIIEELEQVCDDCWNVYRVNKIAIECRRDCYQSNMFTMCVSALALNVDKYVDLVKEITK